MSLGFVPNLRSKKSLTFAIVQFRSKRNSGKKVPSIYSCDAFSFMMDYVRFAKALGLSSRQVNYNHALPNTLVPVVTIAGLQLGSIVAFAIVTETVFQWPGVGLLFINAVYFVDIPVMSAYLLLVGVLFVIINLFVDLLYLAIDPRLRDNNSSE